MWTFESFVEKSERATSVDALKDVFVQAMAEDGFDNYMVGAVAEGRIRDIGWAAFPDGHLENYLAEEWDRVDPVLALISRARRPFAWDEVAPSIDLSAPQQALLQECKRIGIHSILVFPSQTPEGGCEFVGVSRRTTEKPDPARVPLLMSACAQTWWRYSNLTGRAVASQVDGAKLTGRELEILKWIKQGKNNTEISDIVSVSIKTIEYHVGNILRKLGASNRTAAVVIAIRSKILPL